MSHDASTIHLDDATSVHNTHGSSEMSCDVIIIGAGFCGIAAIHRFRQLGMQVKAFEAGSDFGGVWNANTYPGARVDSEVPFYQLNIPEIWQSWTFTERFPSGAELRRYFQHVDKRLDLRKDVYFNAPVDDCTWSEDSCKWTIRTSQGHLAEARYLVVCTGLLYRTYSPDFPGLSTYKGNVIHTGSWETGFTAKGKRVAVIGAGATAVQITQEVGKEADEMTVFVRRPSYCLPMHQRQLTKEEQRQGRSYYPALLRAGRQSFTGFPSQRPTHGMFEVTHEERTELLDRLWEAGGSVFALNNYGDIISDEKANKIAYDYWANKVRQRLHDPEKQRIMAPENAPYYFGTKRIPLEQDYYEVLDQPNVHVHDLNQDPVKSFVEDGIVTDDNERYTFDAVIFATGYDSHTGSLAYMGLKNKDGVNLKESWKDGVHTYLGLTIEGFPNMFLGFGPQAPTALSNGPTIVEAQVDIIADIVRKMEGEGLRRLEAQKAAEVEWKELIDNMIKKTLFPHTSSWWNAGNVPGKKAGNMLYIAGIERYEAECRLKMERWQGFDIA